MSASLAQTWTRRWLTGTSGNQPAATWVSNAVRCASDVFRRRQGTLLGSNDPTVDIPNPQTCWMAGDYQGNSVLWIAQVPGARTRREVRFERVGCLFVQAASKRTR